LFYPALAAIRFNPAIATLYGRLLEAGKPKRLAVVAAMRKLLALAYGVLRSEQPFTPGYGTV
jgi:transposase